MQTRYPSSIREGGLKNMVATAAVRKDMCTPLCRAETKKHGYGFVKR